MRVPVVYGQEPGFRTLKNATSALTFQSGGPHQPAAPRYALTQAVEVGEPGGEDVAPGGSFLDPLSAQGPGTHSGGQRHPQSGGLMLGAPFDN